MIRTLGKDERPRERLAELGAQGLAEAELIALLLNSGTRSQSALSVARNLLQKYGSLRELARAELNELLQEAGIGLAKASRLLAAFELSRRRLKESQARPRLWHPKLMARHIRPLVMDLSHEVIYGLYMNMHCKLIGERLLAQGTSTQALFDVRAFVRQAILLKADVVALAHNHPSGNPTPSESDKLLTQKVAAACRTMDLRFVDHVIVTEDGYYSFLEKGMLQALR